MGTHSLMLNAIHSAMTSSYFYGMAVVRKKNRDRMQTKWPVTTGRHESNANIGTILSVSDQHLHATESAKSFSRLLFSSIDESFKGHWTAGEAFEDYEAAADKAFIDVEADREYLQAVEVAQECLRCRGQFEGCVTARSSLQQIDVNIGITFSVAVTVRSWRRNIKSAPLSPS